MDASTKDRILKSAERYAQQGKFDAAIGEYRKISIAEPDDLTVANTLGDLYVRQKRSDEAIKHFSKVAERFCATEQYDKAIAMYKKIAKLEPGNLELHLKLADLYSQQNLSGEARQQYARVAESYKRAGQSREALKIFKKIADLDPANVRARANLAESYAGEGMRSEASDAYRAAGQELVRKGATNEAVEMFRKALEHKPESRPALKMLAEAYSAQGDVKSALDVIARALEADPNDIDLIIILGRTFLNAGMLEKAEATFHRLFKLDNSRYDYLLEVGRAYVERGEFDRTMAIVDRCIDVMLARRHKKKATALLKAILERDPRNLAALKRLAGIYKNVRERRNLVTTLNTILQVALADDLRAEAVVALRQLIELEPKKRAWKQQLESLHEGVEPIVPDEKTADKATELAVWTPEPEEDSEIFDSYGDYSTELLEEMVSQHPEFLAARLKLLEDLVAQQPAYVEGRLKLKQLYVDAGQRPKAAAQALELARHYEQQGDSEMGRRYLLEAFELSPELKRPAAGESVAATGAAAAAAPEPAEAPPPIRLSDMLGVEEFEKYFEMEWRRAAREPRPISLIKLVVDRFKTFEEEEGPRASLACLERIAGTLERALDKPGQLLASAGNEEFFVLLPETHPGPASSIADGLRKDVEGLSIAHPLGTRITISLGVATAFPYKAHDPAALIESIDNAVLKAQHSGGNRVVTVPLVID